ncbi:MAG: DUF2934 domain-containing protein [Rudaea sp.]
MATQSAGTRRRAKAKTHAARVAPAPEEAARNPVEEPTPSTSVDPATRTEMVSRAAYFRAERRGFTGEGALQDWLEAEAEIDQLLTESSRRIPAHR